MLTVEIISETAARPLHLWSDSELVDARISKKSRWLDVRWVLDNPTPWAHSSSSIISWDVLLTDGTLLTSTKHRKILGWLKRLAWSLLADPAAGIPLSTSSMGPLSTGIRRFAKWLISRGYAWPHELDDVALDLFLNDLSSLLLDEEDDEDELTYGAVRSVIQVLIVLWQQRDALSEAGIKPMPAEPYGGKSAREVAESFVPYPSGWTKPLPDEVAIPILNRAGWFLGVPCEDILRLQLEALEAWNSVSRGSRTLQGRQPCLERRKYHQLRVAKAFQFSLLPGETNSWHPSLNTAANERDGGKVMQRVRLLVQAVRDAAVIVIQSVGGMRIGEICGLPAGVDIETGLPVCIRIEESVSGLNELFICRTLSVKAEETPRDQDWVLGMRPKGKTEVPLAVHALLVLNQLFAPYRVLSGSDRLLVWFSAQQGLPKRAAGVGIVNTETLRRGIKHFVANWIDLSNLPDESVHKVDDNDLVPWRESKGQIIKTHMFRKMWASFALRVDPRLLPAIQMQFHHLSQAITEGWYIGRNRLQVAPLSTVAAQQTNLLLYEMALGRTLVAGRMGEQLDEHIGPLRQRISRMSSNEAWNETVRFANEFDLRLWFAPHGKCLPLVPTAMRCHEIGGSTSWLRREPNYATREPSVCVGCSCFVLDARHKGFWEERYIQNWVSYRNAERMGIAGQFRVIHERASQAELLLKRIGVDVVPLAEQVKIKLKEISDVA